MLAVSHDSTVEKTPQGASFHGLGLTRDDIRSLDATSWVMDAIIQGMTVQLNTRHARCFAFDPLLLARCMYEGLEYPVAVIKFTATKELERYWKKYITLLFPVSMDVYLSLVIADLAWALFMHYEPACKFGKNRKQPKRSPSMHDSNNLMIMTAKFLDADIRGRAGEDCNLSEDINCKLIFEVPVFIWIVYILLMKEKNRQG